MATYQVLEQQGFIILELSFVLTHLRWLTISCVKYNG